MLDAELINEFHQKFKMAQIHSAMGVFESNIELIKGYVADAYHALDTSHKMHLDSLVGLKKEQISEPEETTSKQLSEPTLDSANSKHRELATTNNVEPATKDVAVVRK